MQSQRRKTIIFNKDMNSILNENNFYICNKIYKIMITLEEILKAEEQYIIDHKNDPKYVYDEKYREYVPYTIGDNLDFLKAGKIIEHYNAAKEYYNANANLLQSYKITETETLILFLFEGFMPKIFRVDLFHGEIPPLLKDIWIYLDNILEKTPSFNGKILYRFSRHDNANDFKNEDIFQPSYFFTTTTDDWEQDHTTFIVTPLPKDKTSAKSIYLLYNHGTEHDASENQVTFKRNTKFLITKITPRTVETPNKIYLQEIE